jgi:hypothetical protein
MMPAFPILKPLLLLTLLISGCAVIQKSPDFTALYGPTAPKQRFLNREAAAKQESQGAVLYWRDIKPILDRRCTVCHACYDTPCQLNLGSPEGLDRGATKRLVYDGKRMRPERPTRLFIDAQNTVGWRKEQFYPVHNERADSAAAALGNSLLAKLLQLKHEQPLPQGGRLPEDFAFELNRELECPTVEDFTAFRPKHPLWGMPYALPGLDDKERDIIFR